MKDTTGRSPVKSRSAVVTELGMHLLATVPTRLTAASATVLWHLVRTLPPAGEHLAITALAQTLGLSRIQVTRAMQDLLRLGPVVRGPKDGVVYLYKINPAFIRFL